MKNQILPWILLLVAVVALTAIVIKKPRTITETVTVETVNTVVVVDTVKVVIEKDKVIAIIDTVYVDDHEYTVARYRDTVDTLNVTVDLDIEYWEQERYFNVKTDIRSEQETVYITKTITNTVTKEKPYPRLSFIIGMSPAFNNEEIGTNIHSIALDAGVNLFGKYDISAFGSTAGVFGIRAGIRF